MLQSKVAVLQAIDALLIHSCSPDGVLVPTHAVHPQDDTVDSKKRVVKGLMYWRSSPDDNIYAHPLPWVPILDVATRKVPASCFQALPRQAT